MCDSEAQAITQIMNISVDRQEGRVYKTEPLEIPDDFLSEQVVADDFCPVVEPTDNCTPHELAPSRRELWPDVISSCHSIPLLQIYLRVKRSGMPNMLGVRELVPSQLRTAAWAGIATGHEHDDYVLGGVKFGFPLHYLGPPLTRPNRISHASAEKFRPLLPGRG